MKSVIFYEIASLNYGDKDPETGWYIQRVVVSIRANGEFGTIISRQPIAKFVNTVGASSVIAEVLTVDEAVKEGSFKLLGKDWTLADLKKAL